MTTQTEPAPGEIDPQHALRILAQMEHDGWRDIATASAIQLVQWVLRAHENLNQAQPERTGEGVDNSNFSVGVLSNALDSLRAELMETRQQRDSEIKKQEAMLGAMHLPQGIEITRLQDELAKVSLERDALLAEQGVIEQRHAAEVAKIGEEKETAINREAEQMNRAHNLEIHLNQTLMERDSAWKNRDRFCSAINEIGKKIVGPRIKSFDGDNCDPGAVVRETRLLLESLESELTALRSRPVITLRPVDEVPTEADGGDLVFALWDDGNLEECAIEDIDGSACPTGQKQVGWLHPDDLKEAAARMAESRGPAAVVDTVEAEASDLGFVPSTRVPDGMRQVSRDEWMDFHKANPHLEFDRCRICDPAMLTLNDFSNGKTRWEAIVAKAWEMDGSDYYHGKTTEYFLREAPATAAHAEGDALTRRISVWRNEAASAFPIEESWHAVSESLGINIRWGILKGEDHRKNPVAWGFDSKQHAQSECERRNNPAPQASAVQTADFPAAPVVEYRDLVPDKDTYQIGDEVKQGGGWSPVSTNSLGCLYRGFRPSRRPLPGNPPGGDTADFAAAWDTYQESSGYPKGRRELGHFTEGWKAAAKFFSKL